MKNVPGIGDIAIADMNGPLAYWGPSVARATTHIVVATRPAAPAAIDALARLQGTLHGRTWSGTHTLMSALFAAADERPSPPAPSPNTGRGGASRNHG